MLASSVCSLSCTCPALVPYLSSSCCILVAYARFGCTFHSSVAWMCRNRLRRSHFPPNSRFRKKRSRYTGVVRVFPSRVRARVLYIWCLGGNECLACSALHPSCFLPYFSLRHVLKIPRKGSIVVPCIALHCLFAFIWHLSLTLLVA